jgi:hypothetical protein
LSLTLNPAETMTSLMALTMIATKEETGIEMKK